MSLSERSFRSLHAAACSVLLVTSATAAPSPLTIELDAGPHARKETPVAWVLPDALAQEPHLRLLRIDDESAVPAQVVRHGRPQLVWMLKGKLAPGERRRYRIEPGVPAEGSDSIVCVDDGKSLRFSHRERPIVEYRHAAVPPPEGVDASYTRSGYLHPIWNPSGQVISNDFPSNHRHHHGVWFPWSNTVIEGTYVNFWESKRKHGRVEFLRFDTYGGGPVCGQFRAQQRFVQMNGPDGERPSLDEIWDVRVYAIADGFLFDLHSVQSCATKIPILLRKHRYGGMGFRGSGEWEEAEGCQFLTSEGKTRANGHATRARWCDVGGTVEGKPTGVTIFCHPGNFRAPQPMRIHPREPFFNFTPCQLGDFEIRPGEPFVSRYRYFVHDGEVDPKMAERLWVDYAEPPTVRVVGTVSRSH